VVAVDRTDQRTDRRRRAGVLWRSRVSAVRDRRVRRSIPSTEGMEGRVEIQPDRRDRRLGAMTRPVPVGSRFTLRGRAPHRGDDDVPLGKRELAKGLETDALVATKIHGVARFEVRRRVVLVDPREVFREKRHPEAVAPLPGGSTEETQVIVRNVAGMVRFESIERFKNDIGPRADERAYERFDLCLVFGRAFVTTWRDPHRDRPRSLGHPHPTLRYRARDPKPPPHVDVVVLRERPAPHRVAAKRIRQGLCRSLHVPRGRPPNLHATTIPTSGCNSMGIPEVPLHG
jgi:hypothetical protein